MQGLKIGRNDPCPCGSGNKYKKYCLYKAASPVASLGRRKLRRVESELLPALMKHAEKYYGPGAVHEAWDEFTLWDEVPMDAATEPELETLFIPWFLFNWIPDNSELDEDERYPDLQVARHYLEQGSAQIDSYKRQFIEETCSQPHSFFMVTGGGGGQTVDPAGPAAETGSHRPGTPGFDCAGQGSNIVCPHHYHGRLFHYAELRANGYPSLIY